MPMYYSQVGGRARQQRASGVSAGGNALAYRPDAVPGYTGYTSSSLCIPVALQTRITERGPGAAPASQAKRAAEAAEAASAAAGNTTYAATFRIDPAHDYSIDPRVQQQPRGGSMPTAAAAVPGAAPAAPGDASHRKFEGVSTYQAELLHCSSGGSGGAAAARRASHGSTSAPTSPVSMPVMRPGFLTTSAASTLPVAEKFAATASLRAAAGGPHAVGEKPAARPSSAGWAPSHRGPVTAGESTLQCPRLALFDGTTEYRTKYLEPTLGQLQRGGGCARGPASCSGSSQDAQPPGTDPSGSSTAALPAATLSSAAALPRSATGRQQLPKDAVYLHALDQHPRGRLPGYTGHRPQHLVGGLELQPLTQQTTWGAASSQALSGAAALAPLTANGSSSHAGAAGGSGRVGKAGLMGMFSAGATTGFVSQVGLADAARYHELVRPLEGRMRIPQPSRTNPRGARFAG